MRAIDPHHLSMPGGAGPEWPAAASAGLVMLVGAGPGNPELLTVQASKALQSAQVVLYDHLVGSRILDLLPEQAERIYVGKESSRHTLPQASIIELLIGFARAGRSVLRLKGGDGYIFGRGGEEAQALAEAGVPFTVIPGLTAAQGAAASVGIPLTHRDHADTLVLTTGHLRENRTLDLDWPMLARARQTVVLYMGINNLNDICQRLIQHGRDAQTPAALIERATMPEERCYTGTLARLPALALEHGVKPPALIMVGEVVSLRPQLMKTQRRAQSSTTA